MVDIAALEPVVMYDTTAADFNTKLDSFMRCYEQRFSGEDYDDATALTTFMQRNLRDSPAQALGPCREMWVGLRDPETKEIVAAINQQVFVEDGYATVEHSYVIGAGDALKGLSETETDQLNAKLYDEAGKAAAGYVTGITHESVPIKDKAVETSLLLQTGSEYAGEEGRDQVLRDNRRLAVQGYGMLPTRSIEASYDNPAAGDETKCYDQYSRTPWTKAEFVRHEERKYALAYPEGTSLSNEQLTPMAASLARYQDGDNLTPATPDDQGWIAEAIDKIAPNPNGRTPLGELPALQGLAYAKYGTLLQDYSDMLPKAAERATTLDNVRSTVAGTAPAPLSQTQAEHLTEAQKAFDVLRAYEIGGATKKEHRDTINGLVGTVRTELHEAELPVGALTRNGNEVTQGVWNQVRLDASLSIGTKTFTQADIVAQAFANHAGSAEMKRLKDASGTDACTSAVNAIFAEAARNQQEIKTPEQFAQQAKTYLQSGHIITNEFLEDAAKRKSAQSSHDSEPVRLDTPDGRNAAAEQHHH